MTDKGKPINSDPVDQGQMIINCDNGFRILVEGNCVQLMHNKNFKITEAGELADGRVIMEVECDPPTRCVKCGSRENEDHNIWCPEVAPPQEEVKFYDEEGNET